MEKYCFGIDIGGTTIKIGLFLTDGELVEEWRIPTRVGNNGQFFYDDAAVSIKDKMKERGIAPEEVRGVGIDIPGPVREDGSIGIGSNIGTTGGYPAQEISARLSGIRSKVTNDANAAGLGECWMGAGKGSSSMIMERARGDINRINAKNVIDCAKEGDAVAVRVFDEYARCLAVTINNLTDIIDPEIIVLGGGVSNSFPLFRDSMYEYLQKNFPYPKTVENIDIAVMTNELIPVLGAASLI